jgi:hypothetical protein
MFVEYMEKETDKKPSFLWFAVPIFFAVIGTLFSYDEAIMNGPSFHWLLEPFTYGLIGGLIAFIATKERNIRMAEELFVTGIFGAVLLFILNFYAISHYLDPNILGWSYNYVIAVDLSILLVIGLIFIYRVIRRK